MLKQSLNRRIPVLGHVKKTAYPHSYSQGQGISPSCPGAGDREYWIIDLQQRIVMVYVFDTEPEDAGIYSFEDEITPSLYPDLKIRIADMQG